MKVALVHDFLIKIGGAERVLQALTEMYPEAPIYTLLYDEKAVGDLFPQEKVHASWLQRMPRSLRSRHKYLFPMMPQATEQFNLGDYDLVISSSGAFSHGIVTNLNTKHICYCHSPMRYAWDWTHEYVKEMGGGALKKIMVRKLLKSVRQWDFLASERVDRYVANSEHVQKRIKKFYRKGSDVVYPPVDLKRFKKSTKAADYFLIVSRLSPYKRIDLAVELFNKVGRSLVIIGEGSHLEHLKRIAGPTVELLGNQPDEVVADYMQNARGVIFPGEDDFGIVPVEAMACGKPVVAFGKGGALETVVPGKTGEFFYEPTIESLENAIGRLLANYNNYKPAAIRKRAEEFTAEKFKRKFKKVVKEVMAE